jgi:hypothetical protein
MRGLKAAVALAATTALAPATFTSVPASAEPLSAAAGKAGIFRIIELKGSKVKWGSPSLGTGTSVTYAFATAPVAFAEARNCRAMAPMDDLLERSGIDISQFEAEAARAFDAWSSVADIEFRQVSDPAAADILIGAQARPVGRAFTNVSYTRAAESAVSPLEKSLVCLNPEQPWKVGFDGDLNVYDLRSGPADLASESGTSTPLAGTARSICSSSSSTGWRSSMTGGLCLRLRNPIARVFAWPAAFPAAGRNC